MDRVEKEIGDLARKELIDAMSDDLAGGNAKQLRLRRDRLVENPFIIDDEEQAGESRDDRLDPPLELP